MTTDPAEIIPPWPLHYRLRLSVEVNDVDIDALAEVLDVHRNSVLNYISGRSAPDKNKVRVWAGFVGKPFTFNWLWYGDERPDEPLGQVIHLSRCTEQSLCAA